MREWERGQGATEVLHVEWRRVPEPSPAYLRLWSAIFADLFGGARYPVAAVSRRGSRRAG